MRNLAIVTMGNGVYFAFLLILVGLTVGSTVLCHRFGKRFAYRFISICLWVNFALHFLKQFLPLYMNQWPYSLADSCFPNLCATLIVISPFVFHWGNDHFKDYMYYLGIISGIVAFVYPVGPMRTDLNEVEYAFEFTRYYLCHWPLVVCGFLMVEQGFHKLNWKRFWSIPLIFCGILAVVALDQILFGPILKFPGYPHEWVGPDGVLNRLNPGQVYSNQSMQFGPQPGVDKILGAIYPYLIPGLMTFQVDGAIYFTPAIWIMPIIYVITLIVEPLMALPFEHRQMRMDVLAFKQRRRLRHLHRRAGR